MASDQCDGTGKRMRVNIAGEDCYLIATRATDGGIDVLATVPRENSPDMERERMVVETICRAISSLTRMV